MQQAPKIVIVDESLSRAAILDDGLREAGYTRVVRLNPDVILIDLPNPTRELLEQMFQVTRAVKRPIAMFVDQSDSGSIQASVDAGVSAYIVDGLKKERIKPIVDLCISRFNAFSRLESELEQTKTALQERKVVDRAKGILMKAKNISEESAYALLRKTAMDEQKRIADVAQAVIVTAELLK
jgi:two-component system, response regulator / RNA-binding antiterminator